MSYRNFLDIDELDSQQVRLIVDLALKMKAAGRHKLPGGVAELTKNAVLALIFDKPSTRTRVSFDIAMRQLGGQTIVLHSNEMQMGRGETIGDTAQVLSRYVDAIMLRTGAHENVTQLAEHASIPVINGLTDFSHPCQIIADIVTFEEHLGPIKGQKIAWIGDGNNVATSWIHAASRLDFTLALACPQDLGPDNIVLQKAVKDGAAIEMTHDPVEAVKYARCVATDTWVSMGDEDAARRIKLLKPYQVNGKLMARAAKDAVFMHCLPAHRGEEVTDDVIDGDRSVVFDEAENRLHAQKAILAWCFNLV